MGHVKNVMNNVDRAAVNPEKGKLGVGTDEDVGCFAEIGKISLRAEKELWNLLDPNPIPAPQSGRDQIGAVSSENYSLSSGVRG